MSFEALFKFELRKGNHARPEQGLCVLEAVAWFEGESHSDHPECVCPVIAHYCRALNDRLEQNRQALVAYIPRLVNTRAAPEVFAARLAVLLRAYLAAGGSTLIARGVEKRLARGWLPASTSSFGLEVLCEALTRGRSEADGIQLLDALLEIGVPSTGFSTDVPARAGTLNQKLRV